VINGNVYDMTSYVSGHPGGAAILAMCGVDGTQLLDLQHNPSYVNIVAGLQVGVLTIPDTTNPVIIILENNPVTVTVGNAYFDAGATATDNIDGILTASIISMNNVDPSTLGNYTVVYSVTDSSDNTATATRYVKVIAAPVPIDTNVTTNQTVNNTDDNVTSSQTGNNTTNITEHHENRHYRRENHSREFGRETSEHHRQDSDVVENVNRVIQRRLDKESDED
jgi:hypothetical protein